MSGESSDVARIDAYVHAKGGKLGETAQRLREFVREVVPDAVEVVNPWNMPTFELNGPLCYFSFATSHITFGFMRGAHLDDPERLLEGTGKSLRHVKVRGVEDLADPALRVLLESAVRLNRDEPQKSMGSGKKKKPGVNG
jgi:hypothetical protein